MTKVINFNDYVKEDNSTSDIKFMEHLKAYRHDLSPLGDFAGDALIDPNFPTVDDKDTIRHYLIDNDACQGALDAFQHIWNIYKE